MGDSHSPEQIKKHIKFYIGIFVALLIGTITTVGLYYVYFEDFRMTVAIALMVASVKASLVAAFFMHLSNEKKTIYVFMLATVFFFTGLMGLTLFAFGDHTMLR